ncbi:MaoC family dehydratase N-terminal domain-containing protein [Arsenicicoccus piscis]|uniref:UPF0336 protein GCM10025862_03030 n=1 Tax=Arsenicicoccus piscis TaxID=673954 RepID=A0ABQ6HIN4_9MICO|nr:MaoC family dehydratase N-terminal domain-containing protein [Arsenicicoccus piscis]MCH8627766.1 MaoC family dehydratase N-terminal domain-containing protein [Arsenicicoccus piscis]GMA18282.1 hypothetical protein GCM10025862_03030 [Arsenicicoccus piscis]
MAVNPEIAGRAYPPAGPYVVSRAKIAEFAEAVGAVDPVHTSVEVARERGYADVIAPPTFAVVIDMFVGKTLYDDPESGIDFSRVVHGEQRFTHHAPLTAGDEIYTTLHVDQVRLVGGHAMVTTRTELATADGAPRCTAVSTLVVRGEDEGER